MTKEMRNHRNSLTVSRYGSATIKDMQGCILAGTDKQGALRLRGKVVNDGGYSNGFLKSNVDEELEFGPGAPDEVESEEDIFADEDN